jgi:hypothetical protein
MRSTPAAERRGYAVTATALFTVLGVTVFAQLPLPLPSPRLPAGMRSAYAVLSPQRWGFFATAADTGVVVAYRVGEDGTVGAEPSQRHLSAPNL